MGLLLAVELGGIDPLAAAVRARRRRQALLDEALADAGHGRKAPPIASAMRSSPHAGPPAASSALSRICACLSLRTSTLPRASRRPSASRSAASSVTRYFFRIADLLPPLRGHQRPAPPAVPQFMADRPLDPADHFRLAQRRAEELLRRTGTDQARIPHLVPVDGPEPRRNPGDDTDSPFHPSRTSRSDRQHPAIPLVPKAESRPKVGQLPIHPGNPGLYGFREFMRRWPRDRSRGSGRARARR